MDKSGDVTNDGHPDIKCTCSFQMCMPHLAFWAGKCAVPPLQDGIATECVAPNFVETSPTHLWDRHHRMPLNYSAGFPVKGSYKRKSRGFGNLQKTKNSGYNRIASYEKDEAFTPTAGTVPLEQIPHLKLKKQKLHESSTKNATDRTNSACLHCKCDVPDIDLMSSISDGSRCSTYEHSVKNQNEISDLLPHQTLASGFTCSLNKNTKPLVDKIVTHSNCNVKNDSNPLNGSICTKPDDDDGISFISKLRKKAHAKSVCLEDSNHLQNTILSNHKSLDKLRNSSNNTWAQIQQLPWSLRPPNKQLNYAEISDDDNLEYSDECSETVSSSHEFENNASLQSKQYQSRISQKHCNKSFSRNRKSNVKEQYSPEKSKPTDISAVNSTKSCRDISGVSTKQFYESNCHNLSSKQNVSRDESFSMLNKRTTMENSVLNSKDEMSLSEEDLILKREICDSIAADNKHQQMSKKCCSNQCWNSKDKNELDLLSSKTQHRDTSCMPHRQFTSNFSKGNTRDKELESVKLQVECPMGNNTMNSPSRRTRGTGDSDSEVLSSENSDDDFVDSNSSFRVHYFAPNVYHNKVNKTPKPEIKSYSDSELFVFKSAGKPQKKYQSPNNYMRSPRNQLIYEKRRQRKGNQNILNELHNMKGYSKHRNQSANMKHSAFLKKTCLGFNSKRDGTFTKDVTEIESSGVENERIAKTNAQDVGDVFIQNTFVDDDKSACNDTTYLVTTNSEQKIVPVTATLGPDTKTGTHEGLQRKTSHKTTCSCKDYESSSDSSSSSNLFALKKCSTRKKMVDSINHPLEQPERSPGICPAATTTKIKAADLNHKTSSKEDVGAYAKSISCQPAGSITDEYERKHAKLMDCVVLLEDCMIKKGNHGPEDNLAFDAKHANRKKKHALKYLKQNRRHNFYSIPATHKESSQLLEESSDYSEHGEKRRISSVCDYYVPDVHKVQTPRSTEESPNSLPKSKSANARRIKPPVYTLLAKKYKVQEEEHKEKSAKEESRHRKITNTAGLAQDGNKIPGRKILNGQKQRLNEFGHAGDFFEGEDSKRYKNSLNGEQVFCQDEEIDSSFHRPKVTFPVTSPSARRPPIVECMTATPSELNCNKYIAGYLVDTKRIYKGRFKVSITTRMNWEINYQPGQKKI